MVSIRLITVAIFALLRASASGSYPRLNEDYFWENKRPEYTYCANEYGYCLEDKVEFLQHILENRIPSSPQELEEICRSVN